MNESDIDDWPLVRAGDRRALARVVDRHEQRLFRHAAKYVGTREDAKDATMIAFFELWRKRHSVRIVDGSPLPWLITTVGFVARNLDRAARRYRLVLQRVTPAETPDVTGHDESGVLRALRDLPERDRSVLALAVIEGYSEKETAGALGIPVGTVKSRLSRAKARLRAELEGSAR